MQHLFSTVPEAALELVARLLQFSVELVSHLLFFRVTASDGLKLQGFLAHVFFFLTFLSHLPAFR